MGYFRVIFTLIVAAASSSQGLEFSEVDELYSCDMFPIAKNYTLEWMASVPVWYMPFLNQGEHYQKADNFLGTEGFAKLSKTDLDNSCLNFKQKDNLILMYGFGGKMIEYERFRDPLRKGISYFTLNENGEKAFVVGTYLTKTDNKTYYVTVTTWWKRSEVTKGFFVSSSVPKLDEETLKDIKDHVTRLGFNPAQFVEYSYENCPPPSA